MALLACTNTSCKSYGKPHPNCKCHVGMAEGGDVAGFCQGTNEHDENCEFNQDPNVPVSSFLASDGAGGFLNKNLGSDLMKYYKSIEKGHKKINENASSLFSNTKVTDHDSSKSKKQIEEWMDKGSAYEDVQEALSGQDPGVSGSIQNDTLSLTHPQQNLLIQSAKGRISDYLNSQKPQKYMPKLAFDPEPDQTQQKKSYEKALDIAAHPLSILEDLKKGTLGQEQLTHFNAMYPELNQVLQKKLTDQIIEAQLKGEKPSYKIRQGLSLLMGTPLSGEFTSQNIQAAQAVFQTQQAAPQGGNAPAKSKKSTSALSKSDQSFLTGNQSLVGRQQRQS